MVLVEAMASGLPVISFACPCGPKDIIKDGEDGILVENGNVQALADSLMRLMGDEKLRCSMGQVGVKSVQRYSIDKIAERWKVLFENL